MSISFRIILAVFALLALAIVIAKIAKKKLLISDAVFWFLFVFFIVLLAVFPEIAFFFSGLLGIQSPSHLVFLTVLAILVAKELNSSIQISTLKHQLSDVIEDKAIEHFEKGE